MKSFEFVLLAILISGITAFVVSPGAASQETRMLMLKQHDLPLVRSASSCNSRPEIVMDHHADSYDSMMDAIDSRIPDWMLLPDVAAVATNAAAAAAAAAAVALMIVLPEAAFALGAPPNTAPLPNALVAYGHYLFLLVVTGLLTYERFTIAPGMSKETEKSLVIADASYGISAALVFLTGYYRAVEYGKGFDFYAHEPLFWLKLSFAGVLAGVSLFPTITFVRRGSKIFKDEEIEPMSEKLAKRMQSILNAELSAIASIPLLATLMARGVGYTDGFPWQAGAALTGLAILGSGFVYAKQALTWTEDEQPSAIVVDE
jgi:uncharacterized membrane protein